MPRADSSTGSGTPSMPATMLRIRISSVYDTRAISAVTMLSPKKGMKKVNNARLGMV